MLALVKGSEASGRALRSPDSTSTTGDGGFLSNTACAMPTGSTAAESALDHAKYAHMNVVIGCATTTGAHVLSARTCTCQDPMTAPRDGIHVDLQIPPALSRQLKPPPYISKVRSSLYNIRPVHVCTTTLRPVAHAGLREAAH